METRGININQKRVTARIVLIGKSVFARIQKQQNGAHYIVDTGGGPNYSEDMRKKIDKPENRDLYSKRMAIIEPVFGNITACKRLDRFTLRTKAKVNIQWLLYCMVHNIGKIQNAMVPVTG